VHSTVSCALYGILCTLRYACTTRTLRVQYACSTRAGKSVHRPCAKRCLWFVSLRNEQRFIIVLAQKNFFEMCGCLSMCSLQARLTGENGVAHESLLRASPLVFPLACAFSLVGVPLVLSPVCAFALACWHTLL